VALIACPACNAEVSDCAPACPRCGYPFDAVRPEPTATPVDDRRTQAFEARIAQLVAQGYRIDTRTGLSPACCLERGPSVTVAQKCR